MSNKKVIPHGLGDIPTDVNEDVRDKPLGKTIVYLGNCLSRGYRGLPGVDSPAFTPFARRVGPRACVQALRI